MPHLTLNTLSPHVSHSSHSSSCLTTTSLHASNSSSHTSHSPYPSCLTKPLIVFSPSHYIHSLNPLLTLYPNFHSCPHCELCPKPDPLPQQDTTQPSPPTPPDPTPPHPTHSPLTIHINNAPFISCSHQHQVTCSSLGSGEVRSSQVTSVRHTWSGPPGHELSKFSWEGGRGSHLSWLVWKATDSSKIRPGKRQNHSV